MGTGEQFRKAESVVSQAILDNKTFLIDEGMIITALQSLLLSGQPIIPKSSDGDFIIDTPCFKSVIDGTIKKFFKEHKHVDSADGGKYFDMRRVNFGQSQETLLNYYSVEMFQVEVSGAGAQVTDDVSGSTGRVRAECGTALNGYANAKLFGVSYTFGDEQVARVRMQHVGNLTNYAERWGFNCEMINNNHDNSVSTYGGEACGADPNVAIFSGNGTTVSTLPSNYAHDTSAHSWAYALLHDGGALLRVARDSDFDPLNWSEKDTHIPITNTSQYNKSFSYGIKGLVGSDNKSLCFIGGGHYALSNGSHRFDPYDLALV